MPDIPLGPFEGAVLKHATGTDLAAEVRDAPAQVARQFGLNATIVSAVQASLAEAGN